MKIKKYIPEKIKIKLSSSFMSRSVCKFCLSPPDMYFAVKKDKIYKSPTLALKRKTIYEINPQTRIMYSIKYRQFELEYESFPVTLNMFKVVAHRSKGISNKTNLDEFVFCKCGKSCWAFNNKYNAKRKEVSQRKSKNFYPSDFYF